MIVKNITYYTLPQHAYIALKDIYTICCIWCLMTCYIVDGYYKTTLNITKLINVVCNMRYSINIEEKKLMLKMLHKHLCSPNFHLVVTEVI